MTATTRTGRPIKRIVYYEFLFAGKPVSHVPGGTLGTDGTFHERLVFPTQSVGIALTLRVVVRTLAGHIASADTRLTPAA